jgi:cobalamin biosynthesis Co2+ chelatase CbiK
MKNLSIILVLIFLVGCSSPCPSQDKINEMQSNLIGFSDEVSIAGKTSAIELFPVIEKLKSIKEEVNQIDLPGCMQSLRQFYIQYYDEVITQYNRSMNGEKVDTSNFENYSNDIKNEVTRLNECSPDCE